MLFRLRTVRKKQNPYSLRERENPGERSNKLRFGAVANGSRYFVPLTAIGFQLFADCCFADS